MPELLVPLAVVAGLILLNAAFAGSEFALVTLDRGQVSRLRREGGAGAVVARLAADPNRYLGTVQIGVTLTGFLASATAATALSERLVEPLALLGRGAEPVAVVAVTTLLTGVTLVAGELVPKRIAMRHREGWSLAIARPLAGLATILHPVLWILSRVTEAMVRLLSPGAPTPATHGATAQVRDLLASDEAWSAAHRSLLVGALEVGQRRLREVVVPRRDVLALPATTEAEEALARLVAAGHARAPVYGQRFDDAAATVSIIDLVGASGPVADHARPALLLPETLGVVEALRRLQSARRRMGLVVDEYGGVEGLVTVEDLLEEVVGDIADEHDAVAEGVRGDAHGLLTVPGRLPLHELPSLGIVAPRAEATTLGGLIAERLGRLPVVGDVVLLSDARLRVERVSRRAVREVSVDPGPTTPAGDDGAHPAP